jgi:hypothetical protein
MIGLCRRTAFAMSAQSVYDRRTSLTSGHRGTQTLPLLAVAYHT